MVIEDEIPLLIDVFNLGTEKLAELGREDELLEPSTDDTWFTKLERLLPDCEEKSALTRALNQYRKDADAPVDVSKLPNIF